MTRTLVEISESIVKGDIASIKGLIEAALREGHNAEDVLSEGLMPGMDQVGMAMQSREMFIPEVLLSARTMQASMEIIKPYLINGEVKMIGKVVIGTVKGDIHTIGKNLVKTMLRGAGFTVIDLGMDVSPERFVEAVKQENPDIVGMSALLSTTMRGMGQTIKALREAGLRHRVKVVVGGAPVSADFSEQIGADGYGSNAGAAIDLAKQVVGVASGKSR